MSARRSQTTQQSQLAISGRQQLGRDRRHLPSRALYGGRECTSRLRLQLAAIPEEVPFARAAIDRLCERLEIGGELAQRIRLAVTEACTNCVLHAYDTDAEASTYVLDARLDKDALLVVVRDSGVGLFVSPPSEYGGLGFGLLLIEQAADDAIVSSPPAGGTRVEMRFTLPVR